MSHQIHDIGARCAAANRAYSVRAKNRGRVNLLDVIERLQGIEQFLHTVGIFTIERVFGCRVYT